MAIIKFINSKPTLETLINYVTKESKVFAVEGKDCLAENVLDEMKSVKKAFQKEDGREFIQRNIKQIDDVLLVINKNKGLEPNVVLGNDTICGSFFIAGDDYENADFVSLTKKQYRKFANMFSKEKQITNDETEVQEME